MKRGDIVTIAAPGNYGKPRPALIIQANVFNDIHASITVVPLTSTIIDAPLCQQRPAEIVEIAVRTHFRGRIVKRNQRSIECAIFLIAH